MGLRGHSQSDRARRGTSRRIYGKKGREDGGHSNDVHACTERRVTLRSMMVHVEWYGVAASYPRETGDRFGG